MFETDLDTYWKTVVNTMRDGIMIVDTTGSIISVNRALETITGYSREELIGQKCSILNCSIYKMAREKGGRSGASCSKMVLWRYPGAQL